jgi:hypothetical protein
VFNYRTPVFGASELSCSFTSRTFQHPVGGVGGRRSLFNTHTFLFSPLPHPCSHVFHHQFDAQTQTAGRAEVFDGARCQRVASFGGAAASDLSEVAPVRESIDISRFAKPSASPSICPCPRAGSAATGIRVGSWNINSVSVGRQKVSHSRRLALTLSSHPT